MIVSMWQADTIVSVCPLCLVAQQDEWTLPLVLPIMRMPWDGVSSGWDAGDVCTEATAERPSASRKLLYVGPSQLSAVCTERLGSEPR